MNVTKMRLGWRETRRLAGPGDAHDEALAKKIDEAVRLLMTQDPSPQAYPAVIDAVRNVSTTRAAREVGSSWVVALSACAAAVLIASVVVQTFLPAAFGVQLGTGAGTGFLLQLSGTRFARWVNESESLFGYPGVLFFHTFGLSVVVGLSTAVNLRLLGFAPRVPLASVRGLFPGLWAGFWINAVSGAVLFIAGAARKAENPLFEMKLALVALGVMMMALIQRQLRDDEQMSARRSKWLAILSLLIWLAAIAAGRLMAYVS